MSIHHPIKYSVKNLWTAVFWITLKKIFPNKLIKGVLLSCIFLLIVKNCWSQSHIRNSQINFKNIGREQGLPRDWVYSVSQDSTGYMWIASLNGLNRYDGKEFKVYPVVMTSSTDNLINDQKVYTDRQGQVWSLVGDSPLKFYNKVKDSFEVVASISNAKCMIQSLDGSYYIGTVGKGLYRIHPKQQDTVQLLDPKQIPNQINRIKEYKGKIYAISSDGLLEIRGSKLSWVVRQPKNDTIYSALEASKKLGVWLGTTKMGLYKLDDKNNPKHFEGFEKGSFPKNLNIIDLKIDENSNLWVSTYDEGIYLIDFKRENITHIKHEKYNKNSLLSNKTQMVYEDRTRGVWVANSKGVSLYDPYLFKFDRLTQNELPYHLTMSTITEIEEDFEGNIWASSLESGLFKIDIKTGDIRNYLHENSGLSSNGILTMEVIDQELWISHTNSEIQFFPLTRNEDLKIVKTKSIQPFWVVTIKEDSHKNIWFYMGGQGLFKIKTKEEFLKSSALEFKTESVLTSKRIFDYKEGNDNKMWIIIDKGLRSFDLINSETTSYNLKLNNYSKIYPFNDNTLWIWNHNSGLIHYDPSKNLILANFEFTPEFTVQSINYHNGWFWLGTSQGIVQVNEETGEMIRHNNPLSLQSLEFTFAECWDQKNNILYLGGKGGINWFKPDDIDNNPHPAETVIREISLFDVPVDTASTKNYKFDQNSFTFEISGLQFSSPENGNFKYRLLHHEEQWLYNENNPTIKYSNLPPGEYQFQAISSNYDNVWDTSPVNYKFNISPPWYLTKAAWTIYSFAFALLLFSIYQYFKWQWEMKSRLRLEHEESERLKELDAFKNKLYENVSHELRTPLTMISGPVERQLKNPKIPNRAKQDLLFIDRNTKRLETLVDQILDLSLVESGNFKIKIEEVHLLSFFKQIFGLYEFEANRKNINFESHIDKTENAWLDLEVLKKIMSNLITNALKHTTKNGKVICRANTVEGELIIETTNDCNPINKDQLTKLFGRYYQTNATSDGAGIGLSLIKELVQLSNGKIKVELLREDLIKFIVKLPIAKPKGYKGPIEVYEAKSIEKVKSTCDSKIKNLNINNENKPILLLVEDDNDILSFITSLFKKEYQVVQSHNGLRGYQMALQHIPDIILCDRMMPIMDGIEMTKKLKSHELTSHIPILLITAKTSKKDEVYGLKSGADDYILKPFHVESLKLKVENLIRLQNNLKKKYSPDFIIKDISYDDLDDVFLKRLIETLNDNISDSKLTSKELALRMNISRTQLHRKLKALTGKTTTEFIRQNRTHLSKKLLADSNLSIKEIGYKVGFNSPSYFITSFKKEFQITPAHFRETIKSQ